MFRRLLAVGLPWFVLLVGDLRCIDPDQSDGQTGGSFLDNEGVTIDDSGDFVFTGKDECGRTNMMRV